MIQIGTHVVINPLDVAWMKVIDANKPKQDPLPPRRLKCRDKKLAWLVIRMRDGQEWHSEQGHDPYTLMRVIFHAAQEASRIQKGAR